MLNERIILKNISKRVINSDFLYFQTNKKMKLFLCLTFSKKHFRASKFAQTKADKLETRLIAAMARQDAAYNRYAATVESVNKTTAVVSKSAAGKGKEAAKIEDGKLLKRKLKEPAE